jgi:hypothetical protein
MQPGTGSSHFLSGMPHFSKIPKHTFFLVYLTSHVIRRLFHPVSHGVTTRASLAGCSAHGHDTEKLVAIPGPAGELF